MKTLRNKWRKWWVSNFDPRHMHSIAAVGLVVAATSVSGWYIDGCNEQNNDASNDPGIADPGCVGTTACATAEKHCKGRYNPLKNYRHETLVIPWDGGLHPAVYPLYTAGSRHAWCWYANGPIYWRSSQLENDPTSPWGGVDLNVYWWEKSVCYNNNHDCLYRVQADAHVGFDATVSLGIVSIHVHPNLTQHRCIATRISAGGSHHRVIYLGACPPPSGSSRVSRSTSSGFAAREGTLDFNGLKLKSANPVLVRRLVESMQGAKNLAYMRTHHGLPSPATLELTHRVYFSLSAAEREQLQQMAIAPPIGNP
jgi:hypothetical protein